MGNTQESNLPTSREKLPGHSSLPAQGAALAEIGDIHPAAPSARIKTGVKGPLGAKQGLVLILGRNQAALIGVDGRGEAIRAEVLARQEVVEQEPEKDPGEDRQLIQAAARCLQALPHGRRKVYVMLLEEVSSERILHLPHLSRHRLKRIARFQLLGSTPAVCRTRTLGPSFINREKGLCLKVAAVPEAFVFALKRQFAACRAQLKTLSTRPVAGPLFRDLFGSPRPLPDSSMLVELSRTRMRLSICHGTLVRFSRQVELAGNSNDAELAQYTLTEIQRTNIFIGGRFHEKPASEICLVLDQGLDPELFVTRLGKQLQVPLHAVLLRMRVMGDDRGLPRPLIQDAAALVVSKDTHPLFSLNLHSKPASFMLPGLLAASLVFCSWGGSLLWKRGEIARHLEQGLLGQEAALARLEKGLPDHSQELREARHARQTLARRISDLLPLMPPLATHAALLAEILSRLPAEIIVTSVHLVKSGDLQEETGFETTLDQEGGQGSVLEIRGFSVADLKLAANRSPRILSALIQSPHVKEGVDLSGDYDPFAEAQTGQISLFPAHYQLFLEPDS